MKHLNITVSGLVQGVFFRASTKAQADSLGINGFVRNQDDGSVYLEVEGSKEEIDAFITWLKQGPPTARVEALDIHEGEIKNLAGFEING